MKELTWNKAEISSQRLIEFGKAEWADSERNQLLARRVDNTAALWIHSMVHNQSFRISYMNTKARFGEDGEA